MASNVVSWKEVIERRVIKEKEIEPAKTESGKADELEDDQYLSTETDEPYSKSDENAEYGYDGNIIRDSYAYPGTNQTIVCQVIPSQSTY